MWKRKFHKQFWSRLLYCMKTVYLLDSSEEDALAEQLNQEDSEINSDTDEEVISDVSSNGIESPRRHRSAPIVIISSDEDEIEVDNSSDPDYNYFD